MTVFGLSADPAVAMPGGNPLAATYLPSSTHTAPTIVDNVLYIASDKQLVAIADPQQQ